MTKKTLTPGDTVTCLRAGLMVHTGTSLGGHILDRGQSLTVTQGIIDAATDDDGTLRGIALAADPEAQIARWGEQYWMLGYPDPDFVPTLPGQPQHAEDRRRARQLAHSILDPHERAAALQRVDDRYGPSTPTSTSTDIREHHTVAAARRQQARIAQGIVERGR